MAYKHHFLRCIVVTLGVLLGGLTEPADAQGRGNGRGNANARPRVRVTVELALSATRDVLVGQGFDVVRIEEEGDLQIVYYRGGTTVAVVAVARLHAWFFVGWRKRSKSKRRPSR